MKMAGAERTGLRAGAPYRGETFFAGDKPLSKPLILLKRDKVNRTWRELRRIASHRHCKINLIPLNKGEDPSLQPPSEEEILAFEARTGGGYRMALRHDGEDHAPGKTSDDSDVVAVRFLKLVPNKLILQAAEFVSDDPAFAGTMTVTWRFKEVRDGTEVNILCENVPAGIRKEDHDAGLRSSLENLARFIENA